MELTNKDKIPTFEINWDTATRKRYENAVWVDAPAIDWGVEPATDDELDKIIKRILEKK